MQEMIDQLLDFSRVKMGDGLPIELHETRLDELCGTVLEELEASFPGTRIVLDCAEEISGMWDPNRLSEVLSNLVGNAAQHGDGAEVTVTLRRVGDEATVAVHNFGAPIPDEVLPHLFEPFRRGRPESKGGGLGLGLYIARQIVRSHGGDLTVFSSATAGTTFTVRMPLRPAARLRNSGPPS